MNPAHSHTINRLTGRWYTYNIRDGHFPAHLLVRVENHNNFACNIRSGARATYRADTLQAIGYTAVPNPTRQCQQCLLYQPGTGYPDGHNAPPRTRR